MMAKLEDFLKWVDHRVKDEGKVYILTMPPQEEGKKLCSCTATADESFRPAWYTDEFNQLE